MVAACVTFRRGRKPIGNVLNLLNVLIFLIAITDNTYSGEHPEFIYEGVMHQCIHNDTLCIEL